jgi:unsaturated rhamnogalacturonyl hydrolase
MMKKFFVAFISFALLVTAFSCSKKLSPTTAQGANIYKKAYIKKLMKRAYAWQVANPVTINQQNGNDWARGAFYSGVMRAYNTTKDEAFLVGATAYGESQGWKPGQRFRHADDLAKGQSFLDVYAVKKDPKMLDAIQWRVDSLIATEKPGREDWWWCDALFMEPPVLVRLAQLTGNNKYNDYLNRMWWDATAFLFDKEENLYFRDKSFFDKKAPNGRKVFWSRGNGWVMGGLVQVLERLPKDNAFYPQYEDLYKKMAAKLVTLQQPDGLWRASLLDPNEVPVMETSGSSFYCFALAWGINNGLLDKAVYLPAVEKSWEALNRAVTPEGKLTYVQQIGAKPESVKQDDNQEYGTGALLMAGSELMKLKRS